MRDTGNLQYSKVYFAKPRDYYEVYFVKMRNYYEVYFKIFFSTTYCTVKVGEKKSEKAHELSSIGHELFHE
jgi:hypothetical protein